MARQKVSRKKSNSKKTDSINSKRSKGNDTNPPRKTSKGKVFRRFQKPTKRKSARLYFRSRKPVETFQLEFERTIVFSMVVSKGKRLELIDPRQVIPYLQKIRAKFKYKNLIREIAYVFLEYVMPSGREKTFTVFAGSDRPNAAIQNNKKIIENIERFLIDGASQTKTAEKIYLNGVRIKRFYPRLKRKVSKTTKPKNKKN